MPVFLKDDRAVLFIHVPKTGGTSIELLVQRSGWDVRFRDPLGPKSMQRFRRCSPQHWHAAVLDQVLDPSCFDLVFTMVREPLARFRSEFAMRQRKTQRFDAGTVDAWTQQAFDRYATNPYVFDNHLRPQHEFLLPGTVVYRFEDSLEAMVEDLNERAGLGLSGPLRETNSSRSRGIHSTQVAVSEAVERRVRTFYAEDYAQFGYA